MFSKPNKKLVLTFTLVMSVLFIFVFAAYSSHEFPGKAYRDDFRSPLIQRPDTDVIAGPYRSDFNEYVEDVSIYEFYAGPYRSDFDALTSESETTGRVVAGPRRSDFANLREKGSTNLRSGGPYRADFDEILTEDSE